MKFGEMSCQKILIESLYVDDLIYNGNDRDLCEDFKKSMMHEFDTFDLGRMRYFLGIEIKQTANRIFICQKKYAQEILNRIGMENSKPIGSAIVPGTRLCKKEKGNKVDPTMYKQVVGSLMYLTATRLDS